MIRIGVTGSISSGKSSFAKMLAQKKYPIFNADLIVTKLYKKKHIITSLKKKFRLKNKNKIKQQIKLLIQKNKINFKKLELIIHPNVRKEMIVFFKKKKKVLILEIPLLIENNLMKYFDVIIFVRASKKIRIKRYTSRGGNKKMFEYLDKKQLKANEKLAYCHHVVNNIGTLKNLKKKAVKIIKRYE